MPKHLQMKMLDSKKYKDQSNGIQSIEEDSREDMMSSQVNYGKYGKLSGIGNTMLG
jgi:hypothetical protein